ALIATLIAFSSVVDAGEVGPGEPAIVPGAAAQRPGAPDEPYGVAVTPAMYLVNFVLLYVANPNEAANMPAYRATIPSALYDCLKVNPMGCPYAEFARFFDDAGGSRKCLWPRECQEDPKWERLAPSVAKRPDQINEPLGIDRARKLAGDLGIDKRMIL